ncbi:MAG: hypothetical protein DME40_13390 [Verrucomicrobia bacterium]|nr:MAG: hypothetical protein DME40_13390 [Verrucomicrobiota bacterium]PYM09071.1 MAG: hypothetical protein DMF15_06940 [Verrucomicrobiota bacterium]
MQKATASLFRKQPTSLRLLRRKRKAGFNFRFYPILYSIMKLLAIFLILACGSNLGSAAERDAAISENELVRRTQELYDAVVPGDQAPWKKYFADDSIFADEKGRTMDKLKLIADITPLPAGYSGAIKLEHVQSRIYDNVAILSYDANETETIFGQNLSARYHITDTWLRRDGNWQIIASQAHRYYEDPAVGKADPMKFPDFIGNYELAASQTRTVVADGESLFVERNGKKEQLFPETSELFFRKGIEGRILFRYDKNGKVDALIDRRNNEDVVWRKVAGK